MKKIILTISIMFLLVSLIYTNILATDGGLTITVNSTTNNTTNETGNTNSTNTNSTNKVNNTVNNTNKVNTNKVNTNSSYKNTNLPNTGSENFVIGFVIIAGLASAVYAYIKIKTYNI